MSYSIAEIANALSAKYVGDGTLRVTNASEPIDSDVNSLALAMSEKYCLDLSSGEARAAVLLTGMSWKEFGLSAAILIDRPRHAISKLTEFFYKTPGSNSGIHPTSVIDKSTYVPKETSIGAFVCIGSDVEIGFGANIGSHVSIGNHTKIGKNSIIGNGVQIEEGIIIGDNFRVQSGSVIGSDGFSFVTKDEADVEGVRKNLGKRDKLNEQTWLRIYSLGSVKIGDDVELGSNVSIDRGTIRNTVIGNRTKIDNLVHVGHNVRIGNDCLICGQVGIAGSSEIGNRVILGGQCGVNDNIFVGDDVIAGGATKIFTNAPKGRVLLGYPGVKMETHIEMQKALRRLPRFMKNNSK